MTSHQTAEREYQVRSLERFGRCMERYATSNPRGLEAQLLDLTHVIEGDALHVATPEELARRDVQGIEQRLAKRCKRRAVTRCGPMPRQCALGQTEWSGGASAGDLPRRR